MMRIRLACRKVATAVATVLALACGSDDPVGGSASIEIAVEPASLSVEQGSIGSVTVSLSRAGGFSGDVTITTSGLPPGVTATLTPAQLTGSVAMATLDVAVAAAADPGTYTVTTRASAPGVVDVTRTWQLTVSAPPAYGLTVAPSALTIAVGDDDQTTVNINRTAFSGDVDLALQNPPAGITGTFDPASSTTNASTLTVNVGAAVAPGNYALTILGTTAALSDRTATLQLTVVPPATGGNNVEYQFCDPVDVPAFFAYQDGAGAWQALSGSGAGGVTKFAMNLTQGYGGVLMVFQASSASAANALGGAAAPAKRNHYSTRTSRLRDRYRGRRTQPSRMVEPLTGSLVGDFFETLLVYGATAELAQDGIESCVPTPPAKTVSATVTGVPDGAYGIVAFGSSVNIFTGGTSTNPLTFEVEPGPHDLAGSLVTQPGAAPARLVLVRDLDIPDGGSLASAVDYNGPNSLAPATASVQIGGFTDAAHYETFVDLVTPNNLVGIWFDLGPSAATVRPWAGLPASVMRSGDYHGLIVFASAADGTGDFRVTQRYVGSVSDQSLSVGPVLAAPTMSQVAAGAYPRFRFQGPLAAEYDKGVIVSLLDEEGSGNPFTILATGTWLAASGSVLAYDVTMPDVAGLAGFPAAARLTAGTNGVTIDAFGFTGPGLFDLRPSLGAESRAAVRNLTIDVP